MTAEVLAACIAAGAACVAATAACVQAWGAVAAIRAAVRLAHEAEQRSIASEQASVAREEAARRASAEREEQTIAQSKSAAQAVKDSDQNQIVNSALAQIDMALAKLAEDQSNFAAMSGVQANMTYVGDVFSPVLDDLKAACPGLEARSTNVELAALLALIPRRIEKLRSLAKHSGPPGNVLFAISRTENDLQDLRSNRKRFLI